MRVVDSDFLPQIFPRFFILVRLSPLPHKSILVHSAQKNSHNFIVYGRLERVRGFMVKAKRKTNLTNEEVER